MRHGRDEEVQTVRHECNGQSCSPGGDLAGGCGCDDAGDELLEEVDQEEVDADAESERAFQYERSEGLLP